MVAIKRKIYTKIRINTSGRHGLLSFFSFLPISVLRNLELEANKFYKAALLRRFNISLVLI